MKIFFTSLFFILALFLWMPSSNGEQLIVEFLKPYPLASATQECAKISGSLHKPGTFNHYCTKKLFESSLGGIFATYGGFLEVSSAMGELSFPRKHTKPFIYLIVTTKMTPIVMAGNTIHHWELEEGEPVAVYKFEELYDAEFKVYYWQATQEPIPNHNIIPLESMAIFADPQYVYVPLGVSLMKESPHLILPSVYIKQGFDLAGEALYILNLSLYFGGIIPQYKNGKDRLSSHLTY